MTENPNEVRLSQLVSDRGIKNSSDLVDFLGGLLSDVVSGKVDSEGAKTACQVCAQIIEVAEFHIRNAPMSGNGGRLRLGGGETD